MIKEIYERRSIRKYKSEDVPKENLIQILEAAQSAPSEHNVQPWKFIVFQGESKSALLEAMAKGLDREKGQEKYLKNSTKGFSFATHTLRILKSAPVVIAVVASTGKNIEKDKTLDEKFLEMFDTVSIGAAIENLILEAASLGLGTLWVGAYCYAWPELKEFLRLETNLVSLISVGWPDESPAARPRKSLEEIAEFRN